MHVLHVTGTYPPTINGVAIAVAQLKKELEHLGCGVTVLAPKNPALSRKEPGIIRYPSFPNPLVKDYPAPLFPSVKTLIKALDKRAPDIVHVHHPFHLGHFAKEIADYYQTPLVFTYHTRYGDYAQNYFPFLPPELKARIVRKSVDDFCAKTDLIISPSSAIAEELREKFPDISVASISSGLMRIPQTDKTKAEIRKKLSILKGKTVLLTVCRLAKEKNLALLLESMKHLGPDFFLILVGGGPYEDELKDLVEKENLKSKVRLVGPVAHDKLGPYYQAADLFVYPSVTETQGLIFLEALSFGLPIAAVDSEAAREWVGRDVGVLTANNSKSLSAGVKKMARVDRAAVAQKAENIAGKHTSAEKAKEILTAYERALQRLSQ